MKETQLNCTSPSILEFPLLLVGTPPHIGNATIAIIASLYLFLTVAILCDEFFVPSVERLCFVFNLSYDIAGATFLALATSSPEFFVNIVATFITEGDMGVGTIVGSSVFNSLAVPAFCGFWSGNGIRMDWWPTSRDIFWYFLAIAVFTVSLRDGIINVIEATILVIIYIFYLLALIFDVKIQSKYRFDDSAVPDCFQNIENNQVKKSKSHIDSDPYEDENQQDFCQLCHFPREKKCFEIFMWIISWPFNFLCFFTVPDCRRSRYKNWYVATLISSMLWLSVIIYLLSWMITVIGYNFRIPDSVCGITLLAVGTGLPEAVSCAIVTRKGYGSMALSNTIASNSVNIFVCLGIPWCLKCYFFSENHSVNINSDGLGFSTVSVLITAGLLYIMLCMSHFTIGRVFGYICLCTYILFLILSTVIECNVFGTINLEECPLTW